MKALRLLALALLATSPVMALIPAATATTTKPNEARTTFRDASGRPTGSLKK